MTEEGKLKITRRRLPHWQVSGNVYYVTSCIMNGELSHDERRQILDHVVDGQGKFYTLYALIVMPDHIHVLLQPNEGYDLSRVMKGIKGVTARRINQQRQTRGSLWQDESHDRIMRNALEVHEKANYMLDNPRRVGLVDDPWDYPFWYYNPEAF